MAKTVIGASVEVDVSKSTKSIEQLDKEINDLKESLNSLDKNSEEYAQTLDKLNKAEANLAKQTDSLNKQLKQSGEQSKKAGGSFSTLGGGLKALGIVGAITMAFNFFKDALGKNQRAADTLAAVMGTIEAVFTKVIDVVTDVISKVSEQTNGFEALGKVLKGILTLVITPFKSSLGVITLFIQRAQLAWEESFFGDENPEVIEKLNKKIAETQKFLIETAESAADAGKDIVTNIVPAINEVSQVVSESVDGISKISVKNIYDQQKALVGLKNNAKIAEAQLAGLKAEAERDAERIRQQRDDETRSIEDRIKSNEELGKALRKQEQLSLALADQKIKAAEQELALDSTNVDKKTELINAQTARKDIEAQIAGQYSEQKAQLFALNEALKTRDKTLAAGTNKALLDQRKANAELITDELKKIDELQAIRDEERKIEIARLEEIRDKAKEGTQARVDAEIELINKKNELDAADLKAKADRDKIIRDRELALRTSRNENALAEIQLAKEVNDKSLQTAIQKTNVAIELAKKEKDAILEQIKLKADAEIQQAEREGKDVKSIRDKYRLEEEKATNDFANFISSAQKSRMQALISEIEQYSAAASSIANLLKVNNQNELAELEEQTQRRIKAAGDNKEAVLSIEKETAIAKQKLLDQQFKRDKAMAILEATINTFKAAAQVFARPAPGDPISSLGVKIAGLVATIAQGIANVASIRKVNVPGVSDGGSGSVAAGGASPMAALLPATATATMVNAQAINQMGNQAARAYVLNSDIQNNDQRNAYLQRNARLG